jgi:hypothetical protein
MLKKILKIAVIAVVSTLILLIIVWKIDRAYFHPYMPERNDQIRSDVTTSKFTIPKDQESCEAKDGVWKKIGISPREECNLPTADSGKVCDGSHQCEGVCLADLSKDDLQKGMRGKMFKTNGKCSSWIKNLGCRAYVYRGWASVVCAD